MAENGIRQRPILPGRVQPSTFGTEGLNFCVRDGNRWDPFVIATGNGERIQFAGFAPAVRPKGFPIALWKPSAPLFIWCSGLLFQPSSNRVDGLCLPPTPSDNSVEDRTLTTAQDLIHRLTVFQLVSLLLGLCVKSSPRPISITKLHVLPHFHR